MASIPGRCQWSILRRENDRERLRGIVEIFIPREHSNQKVVRRAKGHARQSIPLLWKATAITSLAGYCPSS